MAISEQQRYLTDLANVAQLLVGTEYMQKSTKATDTPDASRFHCVTSDQILRALAAGIMSAPAKTH